MRFDRASNGLQRVSGLLAATALVVAANGARADVVDQFPVTIDFNSKACATYGDFVSCSAEYLNLLNTGSTKGTAAYNAVTDSPQGSVKTFLSLMAGGGADSNLPYRNQWGANSIDDAYNPNGQGSLTQYGTFGFDGKPCTDPIPTVTGETNPQGTCTGGANATAWDITLDALISVLTTNNTQHQMLIMFDNNQVGTDPSQLIQVTALVCVRDTQNPTGTNPDLCFELQDQNGIPNNDPNGPVTGFTTTKTYGQLEPAGSTNNVVAHGSLCVNASGDVVQFDNAACPAGSTLVNNNLGTNKTEFITRIPELDVQLQALKAKGYDEVAFTFMMYNQNDGFEDIYILAGAPITTPEPKTLALIGVGLLGLFVASRRRKSK